ncbi:zinc-type alcohol dehydrogenase-like protein [Paramyrothecium foliicola]|nr:zinc-type alcohol dehydrogenase-like protein [Paramyrothecium foliicola]
MKPGTMRAVVFKGIKQVSVEETPVPQIQDDQDIIVKVKYTALCGSELHVFRGHQNSATGFIMGHEFSGVVQEIGSKVTGFKPALLDGSQAEYVRVPLADATALRAPAGIDEAKLCLMADIFPTGYFAAYNGLHGPRGLETDTDSVVVLLGCGPVGLCALVAALEYKPKALLAVDAIESRLATASSLGAEPWNYLTNREALSGRVRELTNGRGADVVIEVVGHSSALEMGFELLRPWGVISSVGVHNGAIPWSGNQAYGKNLTIKMGRCPVRSVFPQALELLQRKQHLLELTSSATFSFMTDTIMPLSDAVMGYNLFDNIRWALYRYPVLLEVDQKPSHLSACASSAIQPDFGQISSNSGARQQFARNLVNFMTENGFDGVDIDWKYPGAPDRGGNDKDYDNFSLLLRGIRKAFNDYGHGSWGISITAPSSYWYLCWFNLGELVKHVDCALELFWRNAVDPAMINLGVAFYGRSNKLADASCAELGCLFKSPGDKGECSKTPGYLSCQEIMDKIDKAGDSAEQIWDEEAGVKMVAYDSNNREYRGKSRRADDLGYDQDDDGFNALQALTNKNVDSLTPENDLMAYLDIWRCYYTDCGGVCNRHTGSKEMGQVTVARSSWSTPIKGTSVDSIGCYFGGQKSSCCDAPYGDDAGGILPVPLEKLCPEYKEIPSSDEAIYEETLDGTWIWDIDPDDTAFAWVVIVGPPENAQSLNKRDGSSLETFDCPQSAADDYGIQTFKAVCMADSSDEHDCKDLPLGYGAFRTIARLPKECGADEWVRVVSFREISNSTTLRHHTKRMKSTSKVYEIKYDHRIRDVASDEVFVRIDSSTHSITGALWWLPKLIEKRSARSLSWWKGLFNDFLGDGTLRRSKRAEYKSKETLCQSKISCPPRFDASMEATVGGGMVADIDWGISLIGRVKDTEFEQAYAFFKIKKIAANAQIFLDGEAQFTFESKEVYLLSNFALWGGNSNIKGLVTIGPFLDVTAQINSIATLSGHFCSGVTVSNQKISEDKPNPLDRMCPPQMDVIPYSDELEAGLYPLDTTVEAMREVSVAAQGSVAITLTPSLAFKVQVDINGLLKTDTHITAAFPNRMVLGIGTDKPCEGGLQYWMDYEAAFNHITQGAALGRDLTKRKIYSASKRLRKPTCYKWGGEDDKRDLGTIDAQENPGWLSTRDKYDEEQPAVNVVFPDPTLHKEDRENEPKPEYLSNLRWFQERARLLKRSTKDGFKICEIKRTVSNSHITVQKLNFPSSGELIDGKYGGSSDTFIPDDKDNMLNWDFGRQLQKPPKSQSKQYNAEHVLEHQTAATARTKLAGPLNEYLEKLAGQLRGPAPANPSNPAAGGTTIGAQQGNQAIQSQFEALEDGYASYGPWPML